MFGSSLIEIGDENEPEQEFEEELPPTGLEPKFVVIDEEDFGFIIAPNLNNTAVNCAFEEKNIQSDDPVLVFKVVFLGVPMKEMNSYPVEIKRNLETNLEVINNSEQEIPVDLTSISGRINWGSDESITIRKETKLIYKIEKVKKKIKSDLSLFQRNKK